MNNQSTDRPQATREDRQILLIGGSMSIGSYVLGSEGAIMLQPTIIS